MTAESAPDTAAPDAESRRDGEAAQTPQTHATKALVERLFAAYERGDSRPLFDHVADDVHWTITGTNPLSGEYRSMQELLEATYERLGLPFLRSRSAPACGGSSPRAT